MIQKYKSSLPGLMVMLGLVILGILIYPDYGLSWDEAAMRKIGLLNLEVVKTGNELGHDFVDLDHGAAFEVPLVAIEKLAGAEDKREITAVRHISTFLFYLAGVLCGYLLALRLFKQQWLALLSLAMLVLSPRIFAHAFFNTKDVPFMVAMLIGLYAIHAAFERGKGYHYLLAGAACGFATGIRTMGGLLILIAGLLMLADIFRSSDGASRRRAFFKAGMFALASLGMLYLSWPALWHHPIDNLLYSVGKFSRYTAWTGFVLFNGEIYSGTALPPHYIPMWFSISTPVVWLLLGIAGLITGSIYLLRKPLAVPATPKARLLLICALLFLLPIIAVILLRSVLYDDWRHLYFIYPPFVMLAVFGAEKLTRSGKARGAVLALCGVQAIATITFMVRAHPFQQVYFNPLISHKPEHLRYHFDYEYWGASFKQGLEYILEHDDRDTIPVAEGSTPMLENLLALPEASRKRIRLTNDQETGAYLLTNFRGEAPEKPYPKVWGRKVGGSTVIQIYRIN